MCVLVKGKKIWCFFVKEIILRVEVILVNLDDCKINFS